jgi:predicted PurR-regulated permease PerM
MMYDWTDMMGFGPMGFGPIHLLFFAVMVAVILYPIGRILQRMGVSPFWSVIALIPLVNLVGLWVLAFADRSGPKDAN